jgi:hypothetical protein
MSQQTHIFYYCNCLPILILFLLQLVFQCLMFLYYGWEFMASRFVPRNWSVWGESNGILPLFTSHRKKNKLPASYFMPWIKLLCSVWSNFLKYTWCSLLEILQISSSTSHLFAAPRHSGSSAWSKELAKATWQEGPLCTLKQHNLSVPRYAWVSTKEWSNYSLFTSCPVVLKDSDNLMNTHLPRNGMANLQFAMIGAWRLVFLLCLQPNPIDLALIVTNDSTLITQVLCPSHVSALRLPFPGSPHNWAKI